MVILVYFPPPSISAVVGFRNCNLNEILLSKIELIFNSVKLNQM